METGNRNTKFPKGVPYDYSCPSTKDTLIDRVCMYCGLYFGSIKLKQNHSSYCRTKESRAVGDEQHGRSKITRRTADPRNRMQLVINNTAEQEKYDLKE